MKFANALSAALILLPSIVEASTQYIPRQNGNNRNRNGNNGNNNSNDPQTSLALDPKVIATGFANDGQDEPVEGQVPSLTSTNNFINFCLTVPSLPITNGQQITTGSCNPAPIGAIPSVDRMPSSKFQNPKNGDTIPASTPFQIRMEIKNLQTGAFVNAQKNYFAAPQQLNGQGIIIGHSHVVIDPLTSLSQTTPTDPTKFVFFKGLNAVAQNGLLTADVTSGIPPGAYRLCSINSSSNHQPAIVPVAQHGSLDDCVYFTAVTGGNSGNNGNNNNNGNSDTGNNQNKGGNNQSNAGNQNNNGRGGSNGGSNNGRSNRNGGFNRGR